jgi:hypothetical protein
MDQTRLAHTRSFRVLGLSILWLVVTIVANAQGTAFTYQGKLTDAGNPANGTYDLQFKLFDSPTVGTGAQQGSTITNPTVQVTAGIFTVTLDFSASVFTGPLRHLEIGVRPAGNSNPYTVLSPRQTITSSPYAIQTINSQQLGGLSASRFVQLDGSGNAGIGTNNPGAKLSVVNPGAPEPIVLGAPTALKVGSLAGTIPLALRQNTDESTTPTLAWFETSSGGLGYLGANTNKFIVGAAANKQLALRSNGSTEGLVIDTNGNVGIGTPNPTSKVEIAAQDGLKITGFQPFLTLRDTATNARSILASGNGDFGFYPNSFIGGSPAVLIKNNSGNVGIGTATPQAKLQIAGAGTNGYTLGVEGNVTQNLDKFGFAKAMLWVDQFGTIGRCFNSTIVGNAMTTPPCGFIVTVLGTGIYAIDFRFPTGDRFVVVTAGARTMNTIVPNIDYGDGSGGAPNVITVKIRETSTGNFNLGSFTIIVY